ncbi:sym1 [Symbiodinium natans]|uniref:Sym1 protein n=1 Tax=Symbiodinium natans TaxID=878477 RepID=A0A812S1D8_9DINO|nr:sym1 [Symbiodinium natans]
MRIARLYERLRSKNPVLVQSATAGSVAAAGDLLMQSIEKASAAEGTAAPYDLARAGRIAAFRLCIFGPAYSAWLRVLERVPAPKHPAQGVVLKVLLDQIIWTPPSVISFYVWMGYMEGLHLDTCVERARTMLWPTLRINWPFWGGVQLLTFSVIPQPWRVAWISVVHVFWNAFLSSMNQAARMSQALSAAPAEAVERLPSRLSDTKTLH